ncbi:MAG: c-type cytochrome biogenesis protein CcmI [Aliidongia sp.]
MLFWFTAAVLTAAVLYALLRPLSRRNDTDRPRAAYDMAIYRDQLDEIARDVARGVLNETEAAAARLEIERRLLSSQPRATQAAAPLLPKRTIRVVAAMMLVAVPGVALPLYLGLGSPDQPDAPLVQRPVERKVLSADGSLDLAKAKSMLEAKLATAPDSLEGWMLLARTNGALGDWPAARTAFDKVLALSNRAPDMLEAYGDLLVSEAQGEVTPQAEALLQEAVKAKPDLFRSRYYLGLAKAQRDDMAGALSDWRALLADAPADAPLGLDGAEGHRRGRAATRRRRGPGRTDTSPGAAAGRDGGDHEAACGRPDECDPRHGRWAGCPAGAGSE